MNTQMFFLFLACLAFSGFSAFINSRTSEAWLKLVSVFFVLFGMFTAAYLLFISLLAYFRG